MEAQCSWVPGPDRALPAQIQSVDADGSHEQHGVMAAISGACSLGRDYRIEGNGWKSCGRWGENQGTAAATQR
jgi:hypothetical protein